MRDIYLDNNATTMVAPEVVRAMLPFFTEQYGNPSSLHNFGNTVSRELEIARNRIMHLLGAEHESEIIFTSCGTESNTTAILSALKVQPERREIITTAVEHPAVLELCRQLEKEGYLVHRLGVDGDGRMDMKEYIRLMSANVAVVSVMWANNETGTLFPVVEMAEIARHYGAMFHTDAVQAAGKLKMCLRDTRIDMLSLSGHKLHAPKGIGALYVRRGTRFRPLLRGGHQERGRRAGTENTASIIGLGKAAELAVSQLDCETITVRRLRDRLEQGILARIPNTFVTGDAANRLPNTCNIAFEYIEGESILLLLNDAGIAASSGSACTSGSLEPSHVMRAMGIPYTAAHGTVRFSLSRYNTSDQIRYVNEVLPPIIGRLRSLSPYWTDNGPADSAVGQFMPGYV